MGYHSTVRALVIVVKTFTSWAVLAHVDAVPEHQKLGSSGVGLGCLGVVLGSLRCILGPFWDVLGVWADLRPLPLHAFGGLAAILGLAHGLIRPLRAL